MNAIVPVSSDVRVQRLKQYAMEQGSRPNSDGYDFLFRRLRELEWGRFIPEYVPPTYYDQERDRIIVYTDDQREVLLQSIKSYNDEEEKRVMQIICAVASNIVLENELTVAYCSGACYE
jgi:hypothetical protein